MTPSSEVLSGIDEAPSRRGVLQAAGLGAAALGLTGSASAQEQARGRTFVLVHGAYSGGWTWRRVADLLAAKGHKVYTPTPTGLGDRCHLMSGLITLDTHVADIVNLIKWEGLENIVLVGHSYGGWPVSAVPEHVGGAIGSIVFLDAFFPENGQKGLDLNSERSRKDVLAAIEKGEVSRPPAPSESSTMSERDRAWMAAKATPQPTGVGLTPIRLTGARERVVKKGYVRTTYANANFDAAYNKLQADPSWRVFRIPSGHSLQVEMPERTAEILLEMA
jgi:pimeloyl-ACP methyl ester carboxylesterase